MNSMFYTMFWSFFYLLSFLNKLMFLFSKDTFKLSKKAGKICSILQKEEFYNTAFTNKYYY